MAQSNKKNNFLPNCVSFFFLILYFPTIKYISLLNKKMSLPIANLEKPLQVPIPLATTTMTTKNTYFQQINDQPPTSYSTTETTTSQLTDAIQSIKENSTNLIQKFQQDFPQVTSYKKEFFILFLLLMVLFCVFLYQRYRHTIAFLPYTRCEGHYSMYSDIAASSSGRSPIPSESLPPAKGNASNFAYTMWLNVGDWYQNYGNWKHVYHCGSEMAVSCNNFQWNSLQTQSPGIWMGPNINDLRIVVSTQFAIPASCSADIIANLEQYSEKFVNYNEHFVDSSSPAKCSNDITLADTAWTNATTDTLRQFIKANPDKYAQCTFQVQNNPVVDTNAKYSTIRLFEYIDIMNFPIGEWFQLGVVINSNHIEVYMNGMLMKSQILLGAPIITPSAGYLGLGKSYSGQISKFNYYPRDMPVHVMRYLYKTEANDPMYRYITNSNYYW